MERKGTMQVSVVVPVYNEEENIRPLAEEMNRVASRIEGFEVLFVDDGSSDATWDRLQECAREFPCVRGIRYTPNRGQSSAMLAGLAEARGEILVTIDGDLQNNPADIPRLVDELDGFDAVCGYRAKRRNTWARRVGSRLANRVRNRFTRDGMRDTGCSLKAFRRKCVADLPPVAGVHRFMPAYFKVNGRKIKEIPVDHRARAMGTSKYTNMKRLPRTLFDLVGFVWYRKRYLPTLPDASLTRSE